LAWYHFIAVYLIIAGGVAFTIIPDKPLWLWVVIGLTIFIGLLMGILLPHKEDKYSNKNQEG
jgi:lipoprotein signal peptidase